MAGEREVDLGVILEAGLKKLDEIKSHSKSALLADWNRSHDIEIISEDEKTKKVRDIRSSEERKELFKDEKEIREFIKENILHSFLQSQGRLGEPLSEDDIKLVLDFCEKEMQQGAVLWRPAEAAIMTTKILPLDKILLNALPDKPVKIQPTETGFTFYSSIKWNKLYMLADDGYNFKYESPKNSGYVSAEVKYNVDFTKRDAEGKLTPTLTIVDAKMEVEGEKFKEYLGPIALEILKERELKELTNKLKNSDLDIKKVIEKFTFAMEQNDFERSLVAIMALGAMLKDRFTENELNMLPQVLPALTELPRSSLQLFAELDSATKKYAESNKGEEVNALQAGVNFFAKVLAPKDKEKTNEIKVKPTQHEMRVASMRLFFSDHPVRDKDDLYSTLDFYNDFLNIKAQHDLCKLSTVESFEEKLESKYFSFKYKDKFDKNNELYLDEIQGRIDEFDDALKYIEKKINSIEKRMDEEIEKSALANKSLQDQGLIAKYDQISSINVKMLEQQKKYYLKYKEMLKEKKDYLEAIQDNLISKKFVLRLYGQEQMRKLPEDFQRVVEQLNKKENPSWLVNFFKKLIVKAKKVQASASITLGKRSIFSRHKENSELSENKKEADIDSPKPKL